MIPKFGHILIVDDSPINLRLLETLLTNEGYRVRAALSGALALSGAKANPPDLILLDIMMPGMDGYIVCERLKADERTKAIPVIFVSALNEAWDKVRAFMVGGVDYIIKPFQKEETLARIETQLRLALLQKELTSQNSQLQQEIHDRRTAEEATQLLLSVTQGINQAGDFEEALEVALQQVCQVSGAQYGEAWIPSNDGKVLERSPAGYFYPENPDQQSEIELFYQSRAALTFEPEEGLLGRVWSRGEPEYMQDADTELIEVGFEEEGAYCDISMQIFGVKSGLAVPIISPPIPERQQQGKVLAILAFFWFSGEETLEDERLAELVSAVAVQLGTVMHQKQTEDALKISEATNRMILQAIPDLMFRLNKDGIYLGFVSSQKFDILVDSDSNPIGKLISEVIPLEIAQRHLSYLEKALRTGENQVYEQEIWLKGRVQYEEVRVVPTGEEALFMVRDVSDRKRVELALILEQRKSEQLLLNILPASIAQRLKNQTGAIAERYDEVTILFADLVGFTPLSQQMAPLQLVQLLDRIFSAFDQLAETYGLEKIKTIGDAYMVVGGLPVPKTDHAEAIAAMALAMRESLAQVDDRSLTAPLQLRIGINTGSAVAGAIGLKKFSYDLWGDTVNVASRMESQGEPGKIQVTSSTYERLKDSYLLEERGFIDVKGKGSMQTYWLLGKRF